MRSSSADEKKINTSIRLIQGGATNAKTAAGKDIVLVIGPTGAGKSTLINCLLNKNLAVVENEVGDYEFAVQDSKEDVAGPAIGHTGSCTTYPEVFSAKNGLAFCDTAGFFDTRGTPYSQSAHYALHVVASAAKSIKGILFVCDINTMRALRGKFFTEAVKLLTTMLHTNEEYGRSVFFLITKAENLTHKQVMATIKKKRFELEFRGQELAAELLKLLEEKPGSVIKVSPTDLIGQAGVDFASRMHERLRGAQIEQKHFSIGGGQTGKEEYLQAYHHIINQAFNQIQGLTWKAEDLTTAENDIKTIEQNISSNNQLIITTEEKLQTARKDLKDQKAEHKAQLKTLHDQLSAIPGDIHRLKEAELKEIDGEENRRYLGFLEEINRQHEANRKIEELGVEENIINRENQIKDWEEKINQALAQVAAKNVTIEVIEGEIRQLSSDNDNAHRALDEELRRSREEADQLVLSLQRDADYQNFPAIREIKLEIDRQRNLVAVLDREIEGLESERQGYQSRILELKNDNSDYLIHTSSEWSEQAVYGVVPIGITPRRFPYNYTGFCDIKRDDYSAVTSVDKGSPGLIIDRFIRGRECGGTYLTPSHVYGRFKHYVYISQKNSPENMAQAARLQVLCDGLATRHLEKRIRRDPFQQEMRRLEFELRDRCNHEERRIRQQGEARGVEIQNRRAETSRLLEAALQERNQRIQTLRLEITGLERDVTNREANIAANRNAIIELGQNGRINATRIDEERNNRIRVEEKRRDDTIAQRQQAALERRQFEAKEKVEVTEQAIKNKIDSNKQVEEIAAKLIEDMVAELTRKRQTTLNYDTNLRQTKERHVSVLKDVGELYREFIKLKPTYDAIIELVTLLKLENNYREFIENYRNFLNTLFITVHQLMNPASPSLSSADPEQKRDPDAKLSSQEAPSAARSPHAMFASLPAESDTAPLVPFLSLAAPPRPSRP